MTKWYTYIYLFILLFYHKIWQHTFLLNEHSLFFSLSLTRAFISMWVLTRMNCVYFVFYVWFCIESLLLLTAYKYKCTCIQTNIISCLDEVWYCCCYCCCWHYCHCHSSYCRWIRFVKYNDKVEMSFCESINKIRCATCHILSHWTYIYIFIARQSCQTIFFLLSFLHQ